MYTVSDEEKVMQQKLKWQEESRTYFWPELLWFFHLQKFLNVNEIADLCPKFIVYLIFSTTPFNFIKLDTTIKNCFLCVFVSPIIPV